MTLVRFSWKRTDEILHKSKICKTTKISRTLRMQVKYIGIENFTVSSIRGKKSNYMERKMT